MQRLRSSRAATRPTVIPPAVTSRAIPPVRHARTHGSSQSWQPVRACCSRMALIPYLGSTLPLFQRLPRDPDRRLVRRLLAGRAGDGDLRPSGRWFARRQDLHAVPGTCRLRSHRAAAAGGRLMCLLAEQLHRKRQRGGPAARGDAAACQAEPATAGGAGTGCHLPPSTSIWTCATSGRRSRRWDCARRTCWARPRKRSTSPRRRRD